MTETGILLDEIGSRICGGKNTKDFILLYKAIDKTDVDEFHANCDAKGPTVTILYGKHNTLFGGYTSKDWSSNKNRKVKDENAFLFTKKNNPGAKCFFLPIRKDKMDVAIRCDANFGPTFGGGKFENYDLQAFKKGYKNHSDKNGDMHLNGCLNVRCAYDVERAPVVDGINQGPEQAEVQIIKTKDINSGSMIVKRIEVYRVVDDELPASWLSKLEGEEFARKKQTLTDMEPLPGINIKQYNILLVGAIGSGKSSFFNTLEALFSGKVAQIAPARNSLTSVTNSVKSYILKTKENQQLCMRIFDIRGFENERGYDHELEHLLNGKLPMDFQFPDKSEPVKKELLMKQTLDNEIHLVCFVNGNPHNIDTTTDEIRKRIEDIKQTIAKKGVPMFVVATKFDKLCPKISEDVDQIYRSPKAKEAASKIAGLYGVPPNKVYPVVNYVGQKETNEGIERLALNALYDMYELIEAYLGHHKDVSVKQDDWAKRENLLHTWRNSDEKEVTMTKLHEDLSELEEQTLRVLVVGPTNSGKSSFIDSVSSALRDDIHFRAVGGCTASAQPEGASSTEQIYPLKYKDESGRLINSKVCFGDTPGFQETGGIAVQTVKSLLGPVRRSTYKKISEEVKVADKLHCVCAVFDCVTVLNGLSENLKTTMQEILGIVRSAGIPYIVILTKCDEVSQSVSANKCRVFEDRKVRECKNRLTDMFKFKQKIVFPVVNYVDENTVDLQADALLIAAFNEVLMHGKEKIEERNEIGYNWQTEA